VSGAVPGDGGRRGPAGTVMTVQGPVAAADLGLVLPHEHLLCDLRALWHPPPAERPDLAALVDADPRPADRGPLASDPYVCRPNLLLDDPQRAVAELDYFRAAGGGGLIELTALGLSPRPADLRRIAAASGVHVVAGCGWYRASTDPPGLRETPEAELAAALLATATAGFPGSGGVRPGIIGEIGTGDPIHPHEVKALRAAARVQRATGLALAVHLALWGRQGLAVLDILETAGVDPRRVYLCHLGEQPGAVDYQRALLDRGAWLGFDTFGAEYALDSAAAPAGTTAPYPHPGPRLATDEERLSGVLRLLDAGYGGQLLLSQDVCERLQLRAYGGTGYAHLLTTVRPRLRRAGVDEATLARLFRENPLRLLTGD
jgi:phosphotriesterase-related protein